MFGRLLAAFLVSLALFVYIFIFIFLGEGPGKNEKLDKFINEVCAPSGLMRTVLTWGYFKASFRRFYRYHKLFLFPQPKAQQNSRAPDAKLIRLDGSECRLLNDFILKVPKGIPLILNMGSYT